MAKDIGQHGHPQGLGYLTFRVMFSAMHELGNPKLNDDENKRIFGKCFRTHGHHYYVEATVCGPIDPKSGLCCQRDVIEDILHEKIIGKLNGRHLNKIFPNTSGEALAKEIFHWLKPEISNLVMVRLQETPKNFFTYGDTVKSLSDFQFLMY